MWYEYGTELLMSNLDLFHRKNSLENDKGDGASWELIVKD